MHNLFGDRFLKLFAGDLQRRLNRTSSDLIDQNPDPILESTDKPIEIAGEEGHEENLPLRNPRSNEKEQTR